MEKNLRTLFFLPNRRKVGERARRESTRGRERETEKGKSLIEATSNRSASQLSKGGGEGRVAPRRRREIRLQMA